MWAGATGPASGPTPVEPFPQILTTAQAAELLSVHVEYLRRMVLEIRKLRPDVIITNHSTTSNDHGQHQATALMVVEAFDAAADPNKFP